jgi:DNA polymerase/3'-5' exonuclease PolX
MDYYKAIELVKELTDDIPGLYVVGSVRRKEDVITDLDFVTKRPMIEVVDDFMMFYGDNITIAKEGTRYSHLRIMDRYYSPKAISVDIWHTSEPEEYKFTKWLRTLDKGHVIGYMKKAHDKHMRLGTKGLFTDSGTRIRVDTLHQLKQILDI